MTERENWWEGNGNYNGGVCVHCGRERVMLVAAPDLTERAVCEKCGWDQVANDYASMLHFHTQDIGGLDMVGRVRAAIFEAMDVTDGLDLSAADRYARAAIAVMREPTDAMVDAGWAVIGGDETEIWQAMIDAALTPSHKAPGPASEHQAER